MTKRMKDSVIFNKLIKGPSLNAEINKLHPEKNKLDDETIKNLLHIIKRRVNYPGKGTIMEMVDKRQILFLTSTDYNLPTYIQTLEIMTQDKRIVLVDVNRFIKGDTIAPKTFFALAQNALIVDQLGKNWNRIANNTEFARQSSIAYSLLTTKILDKLFAVNLNNELSDILSFMFAKFYLVHMLGKRLEPGTDSLAYKSVFNGTGISTLKEIEDGFGKNEEAIYSSIFELIDSISKLKALNKIQVRSFVENFVRMYGESTLLAIDDTASFLQMIMSSVVNGNLNKEFIIENTAGNANDKAYSAFMKLIK